jgi:type II secretory pathway pseudopilin PulG
MNLLKNKPFLIVLIVAAIWAVVAILFIGKFLREQSERQRMESNLEASLGKIEYYQTQNGQIAAKTDVLQLHIDELRQFYPEILSELKNLKVPANRVENYSETVIHHNKEIVTGLRDSTLYDTIPVKVFNYSDAYYKVSGIATADSQRVHIESTDSLTQVVYRGERYKPWLWIFSRRKLQQSILSKNPNSNIIYSRQITIQK